jgi:hypothetical protein
MERQGAKSRLGVIVMYYYSILPPPQPLPTSSTVVTVMYEEAHALSKVW